MEALGPSPYPTVAHGFIPVGDPYRSPANLAEPPSDLRKIAGQTCQRIWIINNAAPGGSMIYAAWVRYARA